MSTTRGTREYQRLRIDCHYYVQLRQETDAIAVERVTWAVAVSVRSIVQPNATPWLRIDGV